MSDGWETLVGSALIGSERRADLPAVLRDAPELAGVASLSPPEQIMAAAAVMGAARRAGWRPGRPPADAGPPGPEEHKPLAPPDALALFELLAGGMLEIPGGRDWLLAVWLRRCAATGHRLPRKTLAWLLDQACDAPALRPAVVAAGGSLAAWLGACNPLWAWAQPPTPVPLAAPALRATWQHATRGERQTLLRSVREHDPALGRELVAVALGAAPAAERVVLISALASGLGPDDEGLLEAALDDRSAPVRLAALSQLGALATSARAQRMAHRLGPLVRLEGRLRPRLVVEFPGPPNEAARRDGIGIGINSPLRHDKLGERANWLLQMIAGAPLAMWGERLGRPPIEVVRLGAEHPALLGGWIEAARLQADPQWATLLLLQGGAPPDLARVLDPAGASALLHHAMGDGTLGHPRAAALVANCGGPWTPEASTAVVARLTGAQKQLSVYGLALVALATNLDPDVLAQLERWLATVGGDRVSRGFHGLPHALVLRRRISEVFPSVSSLPA